MKLHEHISSETTSNLFMYGTFMFANIDYAGVVDYVIKAVLGAVVWFAFKHLQDYLGIKMREKATPLPKIKQTRIIKKP